MVDYALPTSEVISGSSGLIGLLSYINEVTNHWFARMLLIGIYVIIIMGYYRAKDDLVGGMAIAGFGTFVVGFLFFIGGFVAGGDLALAFAMMLVGVIWILIDKQGSA